MPDTEILTSLPTFSDVEAAAKTLRGITVRTPLLESPLLNAEIGGRVLVKPEMLQRTGSFKFRGASNRIRNLTPEESARGVLAFSSGNHGQGVAAAAHAAGVAATLVMPATAPAIKVARCRAWGAEAILHDGDRKSMEARAQALAGERGLVLIPPYEDVFVIAGQGTVGLELVQQSREADAALDSILVPCSGGGLTAGITLAAEALSPGTDIHPVEPEGFDDTARSLAAGRRLENAPGTPSICDALVVPIPGALTFAINAARTGPGLSVADSDIAPAAVALFSHFKLVAEPSGAIALAAILSGAFDVRGKTVAVVASGGNVDPAMYARLMAEGSGQSSVRSG